VYLDYYGLNEPPFDITPNPRFLFHTPRHREAVNHLLYGIRERKGFIQLTGEVGAGKTTICRAMLEQLGPQWETALILNPMLDADGLIKSIAMEFGLDVKGMGLDRIETIAMLNDFLLSLVDQKKDAVLIIDEAQDMSEELLEQVRLLSNLETYDRKLLQIVLMGQPELRERLNNYKLRQLRQRITVRYHLPPLEFGELGRYIQHRLAVAGSKGAPHFTAPALWRIHRYSQGVPRIINAVCDKCCLAGFVQRKETVDFGLAGLAIRELEGK